MLFSLMRCRYTPATTTTTTITSGAVTSTTYVNRGLKRRAANPLENMFKGLQASEHRVIQTACSCIETQPPCATFTSTVPSVQTSYNTIVDRATTDVAAVSTISTVTTAVVSTDTVLFSWFPALKFLLILCSICRPHQSVTYPQPLSTPTPCRKLGSPRRLPSLPWHTLRALLP